MLFLRNGEAKYISGKSEFVLNMRQASDIVSSDMKASHKFRTFHTNLPGKGVGNVRLGMFPLFNLDFLMRVKVSVPILCVLMGEAFYLSVN